MSKYERLCKEAEYLNDCFKEDGLNDRAIVIQSNPKDKRTLKIVILRYTRKED